MATENGNADPVTLAETTEVAETEVTDVKGKGKAVATEEPEDTSMVSVEEDDDDDDEDDDVDEVRQLHPIRLFILGRATLTTCLQEDAEVGMSTLRPSLTPATPCSRIADLHQRRTTLRKSTPRTSSAVAPVAR